MIDIAKISSFTEIEAKGHVTIDYVDRLNGKVKERIDGNNFAYNSLISMGDWRARTTSAYVVLTEDDEPIDKDFPYIIGTLRGFGIPSQGSSGAYRGAYVESESYANVQSGFSSVSWKWKYEWGVTQALGNINTVGLSNQYSQSHVRYEPSRISVVNRVNGISDGRYVYTHSGTVVTKMDYFSDMSETVDLTGIVPGITSIGLDSITNKTYVYYYHSTSANRRIYEFEPDFAGDPVEYVVSASTMATNNNTFYVYNGIAYMGISTGTMYRISFKDNTYNTITNQNFTHILSDPPVVRVPMSRQYKKYLISHGDGGTTASSRGGIFDMEKEMFVGEIFGFGNYLIWNPYSRDKILIGNSTSNSVMSTSGALAQYKIPEDAPVRPVGSGMTVTYELTVNL